MRKRLHTVEDKKVALCKGTLTMWPKLGMDYERIDDPGDNFGKQICQCIKAKYNQQVFEGRRRGYGTVFLK